MPALSIFNAGLDWLSRFPSTRLQCAGQDYGRDPVLAAVDPAGEHHEYFCGLSLASMVILYTCGVESNALQAVRSVQHGVMNAVSWFQVRVSIVGKTNACYLSGHHPDLK